MRKMCILVLLLLLLLSPVRGQLLNVTFYTWSYMTTWRNAQAFCREHHTDLVTITNEKENEYVGRGWIGLYRDNVTSPWKWSRGDEIANFAIWHPDDAPSSGNCALKYPASEKWRIGPCDYIHSFTCYDDKLLLVAENKTWEEALKHCRSLEGVDTNDPTSPYWNHRYDLATLITPDDHTNARKKAQEATTDEAWTGLRYLADQWVWVGGEPMQYKDIQSCPTDRFCGVLEKNSTNAFGMRDCREKRNFFCYKKNRK